jgi:hypothetical protein
MRTVAGAQVEQIIHRVTQILFTPEVALRCLDGCVAEQKLDLLQLAPVGVA